MTTELRILKKSTCPKLSSRAKGKLTYHVGCDPNGAFYIRIAGNEGGGLFSLEWAALTAIQNVIVAQGDKPFKALVFRPLFKARGANNHGFLAAALRAEGLLIAHPGNPLCHTSADPAPFLADMAKLIKGKTNLHDDVAEAAAIKAKEQAERIEKFKAMQAARKASG